MAIVAGDLADPSQQSIRDLVDRQFRLGRGLVGLAVLWDLVRERQHPAVGRRRQTRGVKAEAAFLKQPDAGGHNLGVVAETGTGDDLRDTSPSSQGTPWLVLSGTRYQPGPRRKGATAGPLTFQLTWPLRPGWYQEPRWRLVPGWA